MRSFWSLAVAAWVLGGGGATTPARASGQLLRPGRFFDEYLEGATPGAWQALCPTPRGFAIRATTVVFGRARPIRIDEGPGARTKVRAEGCPRPLVLMRVGALREGKIPTTFSGEDALVPDFRKQLKLGVAEYTLFVREPSPGTREIFLRVEGTEQRIAVVDGCCNDAEPALLYAGDVDGDGKLDFVLSLTMHYAMSEIALFLSSRATAGALVADVGHFVSGSC
jgi:hypothetical protein